MTIQNFNIDISDEILNDLSARLENTKRKRQRQLPLGIWDIDDVGSDFCHVIDKGENTIPIILSHGWPDSFIRYQKVIPILTDPARFGRNTNDSFDVVIPSLPDYEKFGALGGDMGSGVTRYLADKYSVRGPFTLQMWVYIQVLGQYLKHIESIDGDVGTSNEK